MASVRIVPAKASRYLSVPLRSSIKNTALGSWQVVPAREMRRTAMAVLLVRLRAAITVSLLLLLLPHGVSAAGECGKVKCGMGTCDESGDYVFGFACRCNPGWSRNHLAGDAQLPFLPCVIPNCTIRNSCQDDGSSPSLPPPAAALPPLTNDTVFDPCLMQYCGDGGACEAASDFAHRCTCRDGYTNLLDDASFPCYRQCSLGTDCRGLGIDVVNGSTPSSSPPAPFSFTVKSSGGARASAVSADRVLAAVSLVWLQAIW